MASLQHTFTYEGNVANTPVKFVNLLFEVPTFEFVTILRDEKPFPERNRISEQIIRVNSKLSDTSYSVKVSNEFLVGQSNTSVLNFYSYINHINFTGSGVNLQDGLSAEASVSITDENELLFGKVFLNALYSLSTASGKYKEIIDRQRALNSSVAFNELASQELEQELIAYVRNNIFLLNKKRFDEAAIEFRMAEPRFNEYALLLIISHVTDLASGKPAIKILPDEFRNFLKERFGIGSVETIKVLDKVLKDELFDFPVAAPAINAVEIKGKFKIITPGNSAVGLSAFTFYDLATAYSLQVPGENNNFTTTSFNWNEIQQVADNTVPFSFGTVITNFINSDVTVRVKAYDGSVVWEQAYPATSAQLQKLAIEVALTQPVILTGDDETPTNGHKKLSGKVIEMDGCEVKDLTVVIQAKKEGDTIWKIIGSATTDSSGNFSLAYPYGVYVAAQALVSLMPDSPADITIHTDAAHVSSEETIADDFLYLLLKDVDCKKDDEEQDDCHCHDMKKSNRLPDQEDLIQSDSYTQDIGGTCINLSTPNRTLNEYRQRAIVRTSDPDVANYVLTKDSKGNFFLEGGITKIVRKAVDLSNPILWQDAPDDHNNLSLYQAVTVATGHILHYSIQTKADGYSLGELIYSLPLAPGQKKEIVVFDQVHQLTGSETQQLSQRESLAASLVNDVSVTDTIAGNLSENTRGGSSASTGGVSAGLGLAGIVEGIAGVFGISGGYASSSSNASQNSSRALSEYFHEQMKNAINQNAQSYRQLNASVVTTVQEGQHYGVTTEVVANHNHCHSLTMMYFEVLRHYAIYQELDYVEECLFIPLLMTDFTRDNIFKWRDVLASHLLPMPSETYLQPFTMIRSGRQHPLLRGFDAIERIKTNYANVDFPAGAYDDEIINFFTGEIYLHTNLPRPKSKYDRVKSWPIERKSSWSWTGALVGGILGGPLGAIAGGYLNGDGSLKADAYSIIDDYVSVDANFASVAPAQCIRIKRIDKYFFEDQGFDKAQWMAYGKLLGKTTEDDVAEWLSYYFKDRLISEWDSIYYNDLAPLIFEKIYSKMALSTTQVNNNNVKIKFAGIDFSAENKYKGGDVITRINLRGSGSNIKRNQIEFLNIDFENSAGLNSDLVTLVVRNVSIRYSTSHYNGTLCNVYVGDDLVDNVEIYTPENANEKRNPKKEDAYIAQKLIEHLNSNLEHYNKALWRDLDPDRRYMLLDGFNIETYNDFGLPIGRRSLASVVKNELIGIAGNALIMPVAPGYKIDRTFIVEQPIEGEAVQINLLDHYKPLTPIPPYRISIPSKGVFAEAVQGVCDACEKVKDNTSQDWEKFKTDEPTPINPVTVPVPEVTDWKAAFKDFATPIVNIQNAPAAPAPGSGLAAAAISDVLSKSGIFKDITGLDQNQKNAMQTYLSNQENAKAFAEMAKEIYMMGHNTEHSDKIADSIRNSPELSKEEKAELLKDHFGQMVDGGQSKKAEQENANNSKPSLTDAAVKAVDEGKAVKATSADGKGKVESVEIGAGGNGKFRVAGKAVPLISQGNKDAACWAAAAAMMKSWKDGKTYTIEEVLAKVPAEYLDKYNNNQPLLPSEKHDFIDTLEMTGEPQGNYSFDDYVNWMKTYGPLWITIDSDSSTDLAAHAIILIGYDGDGTETNSRLVFLDPSRAGEQSQTFAEFSQEFEQAVRDNSGEPFIQVVHFKDKIAGEGNATTRAMINYTPATDSTMVINKIEFETIAGVLNWSNATVEHNRNDNGNRSSTDLIHLVLHETASPVASEATAHGFNGADNTTSHMTLMRNGTILQFNDLRQIENHTKGLNTSAIGVEFVNRAWLASPKGPGSAHPDTAANLYSHDHEAIPAKEANLTAEQLTRFPKGNDYLYCFWGNGFNIYRIPPDIAQLEKEVELVQWLTTDLRTKLDALDDQLNFTEASERNDLIKNSINPALPVAKINTIYTNSIAGGGNGLTDLFFSIERKWLQLASYEDVSGIWNFPAANIPPLSEQTDKNLFIFTTGWSYLEPANIAGKSGIVSHNSVKSNHPDGSFLTLYTWLRLEKGFDSAKSYRLTKSLMTDHFFIASLKTSPNDHKIVILNVADANLV